MNSERERGNRQREQVITLRSEREILKMRRAGLAVWHAHQIAASYCQPGITTGEIDAVVERFFDDLGAVSLFKGFPGAGAVDYPAVTCISVNEEVVHGIPGKRVLQVGDIVGIDTGCRIDGWCGDAALTHPVGPISELFQRLLDVTSTTLNVAIEQLGKKQRWSEVAREMEKYVRSSGFSVIETLVGHGIGREMHEHPQVPNYVCSEFVKSGDFEIRPGLVIAVEPMVNIGSKRVRLGRDRWTISTIDRKGSAHFEHTIAILESGPFVLTGPPRSEEERIDISAYLRKV
ncbi:MAG: type I methionyl aminopeptidase [Thermoguttaceae bacterium]